LNLSLITQSSTFTTAKAIVFRRLLSAGDDGKRNRAPPASAAEFGELAIRQFSLAGARL
jgi:hypothetical protein